MDRRKNPYDPSEPTFSFDLAQARKSIMDHLFGVLGSTLRHSQSRSAQRFTWKSPFALCPGARRSEILKKSGGLPGPLVCPNSDLALSSEL
jgi:hypothetical protein